MAGRAARRSARPGYLACPPAEGCHGNLNGTKLTDTRLHHFSRSWKRGARGCAKALRDSLESDRYRCPARRRSSKPQSIRRSRKPRAKPAVSPCRRRRRPPGDDSERRRGTCARTIPTKNSTRHASEPSAARYTAELIAPLLGRRAARAASEFIRLTTRVQDCARRTSGCPDHRGRARGRARRACR